MIARGGWRIGAIGGLLAVAVAVAGCGGGEAVSAPQAQVPLALSVTPADVSTVVIRTADGHVVLHHDRSGVWSVEDGPSEALPLWITAYDDLLPLLAYREFTVDNLDPAYGLEDPQITLEVEERSGSTAALDVGRATRNGEGFYARRRGADSIYLITRGAASSLVSVAEGEYFTFPMGEDGAARVARANALDATADSGAGASDSEPPPDPWLQQALDVAAAGAP